MPNIKVINTAGEFVEDLVLNESVFGVEYNEALIHQVVVAQNANKRQGTKCTLTRTEVRGGGRKPWRQKGTGRARQGSIRSPQWVGGGVVFAPKPRDFRKGLNTKAKASALRSALSTKLAQNEIIVLDKIDLSIPKTKEMVKVLANIKVCPCCKALIVSEVKNDNVVRASNNLANVTTTFADLINVLDVVKCGMLVMTKDAVLKIEEAYKV